MLKARHITLTIILLLTEVIYSQQHHFVKKDLEIPSQEAYNIYQDSQGYIWFSTMRGLCRYSGSKIKIFDKTTGLPESAVYTLTEDKKGTIWILTKNNHILYYKGGEFHEPEFSKKYRQIEELGLYNFTFHLRLIENDTKLALLTYKATYIIDIASGDIEKIHSNVDPYGTILEFRNYQTELIQTSPTLYTRTNVLKVDIKNPSNQTEIILNKLAVDDNQLTRVALTKVVESKRYFTFANTLFCHDTSTNQTSSFRCSKRIIGLYSDKSNGIWVGIVGGGLYYFSDGDLTKTPIHSLKDYSVSGICETTDGSIWVTTLEKGVFHSKSKHILTYHDLQGLDKIADALIPYNNHYIFTSSTTNATLLNKHEIIQLDIKKHFAEPIMAIHDFNGYKYITSKQSLRKFNHKFNFIKTIFRANEEYFIGGYKMIQNEEKLYSIFNNIFYYNEKDKIHIVKTLSFFAKDFIKTKENKWIIVGDGIQIIDVNNHDKVKKIDSNKNSFTKIIECNDGRIFIGSNTGELYELVNDKLRNHPITLLQQISTIYDLVEDQFNRLWIATNNGVYVYDVHNKLQMALLASNGLLSNEVQKLAILQDEIYLSTVEGICKINLNSFKKVNFKPIIYPNSIKIGNKNWQEGKIQNFSYQDNDILIDFDIIQLDIDLVKLHYVLDRNNEGFLNKTLKDELLDIQNIPPGKYKLTVWGETINGEKSEPITIQFTINPPFWKSTWFLITCMILSGILIYIILIIYLKNFRKKEYEKTRINKLIANTQLSALQAQMNPHFIFNSINSIQNYILTNDRTQAYNYLTKFSRLIRIVLQNSRKNEITLSEDLVVLRLYIGLEQMRFDNAFNYIEEIDPDIDLDNTYIVPMLIQPLLENAIWHGIMPLNGKRNGTLILRLYIELNTLNIEVEDNGVGRSIKQEKGFHESISIDSTVQRLNMINYINQTTVSNLKIIDLIDDSSTPCGTKVIITIPLEKEEL